MNKKPNYKIFRVEPISDPKSLSDYAEIVMKKFYAENDDKAYEYLQEYKKAANKKYTYYYGSIYYHRVCSDDGTKKMFECESLGDALNMKHKYKMQHSTKLQKVKYMLEDKWLDIQIWFEHYTIDIWNTFVDKIKDLLYFNKHQQYRCASWSLDSHILDTLMHHIPILIENKHGISYPYLDMARKELHKNDKAFNLSEYNKEHYDYTDEEEKLADEYQKKSYNELLLNIRLYRYYLEDYSYIDPSCKELVELDKKYHHTLPIKPGTYNYMDYGKLQKLSNKYWNKIWEWMRIYGQTLWD